MRLNKASQNPGCLANHLFPLGNSTIAHRTGDTFFSWNCSCLHSRLRVVGWVPNDLQVGLQLNPTAVPEDFLSINQRWSRAKTCSTPN